MSKWIVKFSVSGVVEADSEEEAKEIVNDEINMMNEVEWYEYSVDDPFECKHEVFE